jgi:uncharacterized protein (TIGR02453 family)
VGKSKLGSVVEFEGFSPDLLKFLRALARHNDKNWFDAHRGDYEALFLEPARAFATAMQGALKAVGPEVRSEPRVNGSIMRINRDTRFSKDKTPYKTAMHFMFPVGGGPMRSGPGYYLRIAENELGIAAGLFGFAPDQLAAYRDAVVDSRRGRALRAAVDRVRKAGPYELNAPGYKRVPKGYDPDHPNADFLLMKGFYAFADMPVPRAFFSREAIPFVIERFKELKPIPVWLSKVLG